MSEASESSDKPGRFSRRWLWALLAVVVLLLVTSPLWGPRALRHLAFFRVRRVEILGARYTVIETGHYAPVQTPELYARTIGEFLDAVGA